MGDDWGMRVRIACLFAVVLGCASDVVDTTPMSLAATTSAAPGN